MALEMRDISSRDDSSFSYIFEQNVSVPLKTYDTGLVRVNVYRPHDSDSGQKYPVLVTYGPYGKDYYYGDFRKPSFDEVNPEHKSEHSAWETPDPKWWTSNGYIVVRADEKGIGQSPGVLDTMSRGTSEAFFDVVEWCAQQPWSSGKVGLLGISYYAGTQWRVAARRPKGLAAIVPWEGMSDYYRDRCRHGGILANNFLRFWWHAQVLINQYGRKRPEGSKNPETIEGLLDEEQLKVNTRDQTVDTSNHKFLDEDYYASRDYALEDIEVPVLSVANWGGILLHLRGNVEGYIHAGSRFKYLRFITGRHDLPFYYHEEALLQKSFLDAFLKDIDDRGWTRPGEVAPVSVVLRKGDVGYNNAEKEKQYQRREESAWPLPNTQYEKHYLLPDMTLSVNPPDPSSTAGAETSMARWRTMADAPKPPPRPPGFRGPPPVKNFDLQSADGMISFTTPPFTKTTEFTGHIVAHLNVTIPKHSDDPNPSAAPSDIDLFLTLRHFDPNNKQIFYTGTAGDPVPLTKGWLRCSLRAIDTSHPRHRDYLPYRSYSSGSVQPIVPGEVYAVDVEVWPTNVVVDPGSRLVLEISGADTQGSGVFTHDSPVDRDERVFKGWNAVVWGEGRENYVTLPRIPSKKTE